MRKDTKKKFISILLSICFHVLIFLLLSMPIMSLKYPDPPIKKSAIPIKFGEIKESKEKKEENKEENLEHIEQEMRNEKEISSEEIEEITLDETSSVQDKIQEIDTTTEITTSIEQIQTVNPDALFNPDAINKGGGDHKQNRDSGSEKGEDNGEKSGDPGTDLGNMPEQRKGPKTLPCAQGLGNGKMSVKTIIDASGKIVFIYEETFKSTLPKLSFTKRRKKDLLDCIKKEYRHDPDPEGNNMPNKKFSLHLEFKQVQD